MKFKVLDDEWLVIETMKEEIVGGQSKFVGGQSTGKFIKLHAHICIKHICFFEMIAFK